MTRYCLTLNLKNDPALIQEYIDYHRNVWPEIKKSITDSGIIAMQIYRMGTRLFMIMDTEDDFSFDHKNRLDAANSKVSEWENLMWRYQEALPEATNGEKWMLMERIYEL